ncbi:FtsX-like permease family protein [Anaerococcus sp. Marseille-P9784]|uniref:FtsX-like permease family protein n=1 Tax=Anaerococcus sp. Marseille-P9784 TaxID=2614127 RepID=UPI00124A31CC|nr:FtsX-like permease family protein [Anaerococcus sp. Marseille-P9784]
MTNTEKISFNKNIIKSKENIINILILVVSTISFYSLLAISNNELFLNIYDDSKKSLLIELLSINIISFVLISTLIIYTNLTNLKSKRYDINVLLLNGIGFKKLFKILLKDQFGKFFVSLSLGLVLGVYLSEFINLAMVKVFDLNIYAYNFNISQRAIFITIILIAILEIVSVFIFTTKVTGKYPGDKILKNKRTSSFLIILIMVVLGSLATSVNLIFREEIIFIIITNFILLFLTYNIFLLLLRKSNILLKSQFRFFIKTNKILAFLILIMLSLSIIMIFKGCVNLYNVETDGKQRPDFTVVSNEINKEDLYKIESINKYVKDIYPIKLTKEVRVNEEEFLYKYFTPKNIYVESVRNLSVINFSTYKSSFKNSNIDKLDNDQAIFLYDKFWKESNIKFDSILSTQTSKITIGANQFEIIHVDKEDNLFANDILARTDVYVLSDEIYEKFFNNEIYGYNLILKENILGNLDNNKIAEILREDLLNLHLRFESKVWMLKNNYTEILRYIYTLFYMATILFFVGCSFLIISIYNYILNNKNSYKILKDLGETAESLSEMLKKLINLIFVLIIIVILAEFALNILFNQMTGIWSIYSYHLSNFREIITIITIISLLILIIIRKIIFKISVVVVEDL